ncbi:MAG: hypothetical protein AB1705_22455 [Verrucomicrobiota bacterium]
MSRDEILRRRIRCLTWLMIVGLIFSGLTAIPLEWELGLLARWFGIPDDPAPATSGFAQWIARVRAALQDTDAKYPFIAYGFDWLAFGHVVIAIAFGGALRDPVRNAWLFQLGMIACVLVIPWALVFGQVRGIPLGWRVIDCLFGIVGFVPMWLCARWTGELGKLKS